MPGKMNSSKGNSRLFDPIKALKASQPYQETIEEFPNSYKDLCFLVRNGAHIEVDKPLDTEVHIWHV